MSDPGFNQALGEFRALVGIQLAHIAAAFGLDLEEPLSNILSLPDRDTDTPPAAIRSTSSLMKVGPSTSNLPTTRSSAGDSGG
jgi:hypothetical protein